MRPEDAFSWLRGNIPATPDEQQAAAMNAEAINAENLRQWEAARIFLDVFGTGRGPELLMVLRDATIELPLMEVAASTVRGDLALSPAEWAYVREGQNSVVRLIESQMRIAKGPAPNFSAGEQSKGEDNA